MGNTPELLPHFPELLPLDRENWGNGARIGLIWEVLKEGAPAHHSLDLNPDT
jgi:hypothetical protein